LPYSLEACTSTSSTFGLASAWLCFATFTSPTEVYSCKLNSLLGSINGIHEVNLNRQHDIFASLRSLLLSPLPLTTLLTSEKLLKLFKYVSKWLLSRSSLPLLLLEAVKASKATTTESSATKPAEGVLASLLLFVSSHACLIINSLLLFIAQYLICFIYFCKLLFG
jgi:hypothetical protein